MRIERIVSAFGEIRQALDKITVGYHEFKDALVVALVKRSLGIRGGHVLVFGPTGTAKTHTTKGLARILSSVGVPVPYARVSGNPDTMPSDFLMRRVSDYDDQGRPRFKWELQDIEIFERKSGIVLPGLFQFDELDKITSKAQHGLLEVMEEQQASIPKRGPVGLNFTLVATANTRKFDPTAQPLSRAIQDRFGSVVVLGYQSLEEDLEMLEQVTSSLCEPEIRLNHFPASELEELRKQIQESGLPLQVSRNMRERIAKAIKLTQQTLDGYTDFRRYIKVPAGPRAILDLYWESGIAAMVAGADELTAEFPLQAGLRTLRGRVEVEPAAEMDGMTTDVVITRILAEVFGGDAARSSGSRPFEQTSSGEGSTPEEKEAEKVEQKDEESKKKAEDSESKQKKESKADSKPQALSQPRAQPASTPQSGVSAGKQPKVGQRQSQPWKDYPQPESQPRQQPKTGDKPDWQKESFLADLRKEAQKDKQAGKEAPKKGTDQVSPSTSQSREDVHGGENAAEEVPESPMSSQQGKQEGQSPKQSAIADATGQAGQPGQGSQAGGDSQAGQDSGSSGVGQPGKVAGQRGESSGEGEPKSDGQNGQGKAVKTIASRQALAQWLAQQAAAENFRTTEGVKTGAEIAQDLASGRQKFDFQSADGKFKAHVRGQKAIAQGEPGEIQKLAKQDSGPAAEHGIGGHAAGKGPGFPTLDVFTFPPSITSILPMLREMPQERIIEKLGDWVKLPPNQKARTGVEYRLIKGFVHLAALQAVRNSEELESSKLTKSASGERVDFVVGRRDDLPLDEERTMLEALVQGGIVDDLSEVHEKRVRSDAPQLLFVLDGSGSMGYENRMMSAAVSAAACAQKYGPLGATMGLIAFTSNPALVVPMPETEVERVEDGIFSVSPGGGTSYSHALELAFRHVPPRTTLIVLGDFMDSGLPSQEALAFKSSKELKVVGIVSSAGDPQYANEICDEVYLVGFEDPTSVALCCVKAAI